MVGSHSTKRKKVEKGSDSNEKKVKRLAKTEIEGNRFMALRGIGPEGRPYKKHFLELNGLGSRDLCWVGPDLLILAGPTMNLDRPVVVFRWSNAIASSEEQVIFSDRLEKLFVVPNGAGTDHEEGMALVPENTEPRQV